MEFLNSAAGMELGVRMIAGFLASVAAITLWAHSREPAWIFVIAAVLLNYIEIIFRFLDMLGIFSLTGVVYADIPWLRLAFAGVVPLLLLIGLVLAIRSYYKP